MITLVFGKGESGKTHWLRHNVTTPPIVGVDPIYQFRELVRTDLETVILHPDQISRGSLYVDRPDFHFVVGMAIAYGWNLLVDEIDFYTSPHYGEELIRRSVNTLDSYVRYGRHGKSNLYCASRRPAEVPDWLIANADRMVLFHLHQAADLRAVRGFVSAAQLAELPRLPRHKFLDIQLFPE